MNATDTPQAIPIAAPGEGTIATRVAAGLGLRPTLLEEWYFLRLAIVYVRQSDPQQVLNHLESRERQYALVDLAAALGWPRTGSYSSTRTRESLARRPNGEPDFTASWPKLPWIMWVSSSGLI